MTENIGIIIQARMTSTRLPGKVLRQVNNKPLLQYMVERLQRIQLADQIVIATTTNQTDDCIAELATRLDIGCFRGSEEDVLDRVLQAAKAFKIDIIVETTGDCPLIDPIESNKVIEKYLANDVDYVSNVLQRTYPRGMDTQVFSTATLDKVAQETQDPIDREHVSYYIYQHPEQFNLANISAPSALNHPEVRLTVDTIEDATLIETLIKNLYADEPCPSLEVILKHLQENPKLLEINQHVEQKKVEHG